VGPLKITFALVALATFLFTPAISQPASAVAARTLRIGMVANTNGVGDRSFNELAQAGVRAAAVRLGASIAVTASPSPASYVPALTYMAQQRYDLVIAVGSAEEQAVGEVARQFPRVNFAIVDDSYASSGIGGLENVQGLLFRQEEAGYLAGYLAGLVETETVARLRAGNIMSTVGSIDEPSDQGYIAGFRAGAKASDPTVKLLHAFADDSSRSEDRCHSLAATQIAAGSDIVLPAGGSCGVGALNATNQQDVWGIAVDADQSYLGPYVLASAVKRVDQAVYLAIKAVHDGTFKGGRDVVFGIAQNAVGISGINRLVPRSIRLKVNAVAAKLRAGKISIPIALGSTTSR
jgi:basic membrane protein A and related proteins